MGLFELSLRDGEELTGREGKGPSGRKGEQAEAGRRETHAPCGVCGSPSGLAFRSQAEN